MRSPWNRGLRLSNRRQWLRQLSMYERVAWDRAERERRSGRQILGDELIAPMGVLVVTPELEAWAGVRRPRNLQLRPDGVEHGGGLTGTSRRAVRGSARALKGFFVA
jgi:hypothetical protein